MPTGPVTVTSVADSYKIRWPTNKLAQLFFEESPLAQAIPVEEFSGQNDMRLPVEYGAPQGRSADFTTAMNNVSSTETVAFRLTTARDYGIIEVTSEALEAGKSADALIDTMSNQTKGIIYTIRHQYALDLYGDGSGKCGVVKSVTSATNGTITLVSPEDTLNFEKNKPIAASSDLTNSAATGPNRAGTALVTAVDRDAGTVTFSGTITGLAAGDLLFAVGDYRSKIVGFGGWNPITAPQAGDNFFNVDRSPDQVRLAGWRHVATESTVVEAIESALSRASRHGSRPDMMVCGTAVASQIRKSLLGLMRIDKMQSENTKVVLDVESFSVANRRVTMIEDPQCPPGIIRFWKKGTVKVYARRKQIPMIMNRHGSDMYPHPTRDSYVMRLGYFAQMGCSEPLHLGVITGL